MYGEGKGAKDMKGAAGGRRSLSGRAFRTVGVVAASAGMAAAIAACGGGGSTPTGSGGSTKAAGFYTGGTPGGTPVHGGKVVIDLEEKPVTFDPVASPFTTNSEAVAQINESLVATENGSKAMHPALASSWTISPDGKTYTFHIREGVKFSNGEPLTGEDVVYSLERQKLPIAICGTELTPVLKKLSLSGPMTVKMELDRVDPSILGDLSLACFGVVPKHVLQHESEKTFSLHPVGTGPFELKSASPGFNTITMVRNPHYWRTGQPYIDELEWNQVSEANARILAVRSGSATIDLTVPFSQVATLKSTPGVRVLVEPLLSESVGLFNDGTAPFNNLDVRKALNYATPRTEIIKAVYKGLATPANNVTTNGFLYYDSSVPSFPYDIAKAKALMKESSTPNGFNMSMITFSGEPDSALIASILQSSWAQIGVHLHITPTEPSNAYTSLQKDTYQSFLWTPETLVAETYEPDLTAELFAGRLTSTVKISNFKSARVTPVIEKATTTLNETERAKLFAEYQRLIAWEEAAFLPIAFTPQVNLVSTSLRGFTYPPNCYFRMREVWLAQ
jgi:peptide/nickel transport system substrate-binding protein